MNKISNNFQAGLSGVVTPFSRPVYSSLKSAPVKSALQNMRTDTGFFSKAGHISPLQLGSAGVLFATAKNIFTALKSGGDFSLDLLYGGTVTVLGFVGDIFLKNIDSLNRRNEQAREDYEFNRLRLSSKSQPLINLGSS